MNPSLLLKHFHRISEAPDAIPRLRRFVLDLAVRGKLVPQDPKDEPASELLQRINNETTRLIRSGAIKHSELHLPVNASDISFDLPNGWCLARLEQIATCLDHLRKPINSEERAKRIFGKSQNSLIPYFGATQQQGWIDKHIFDEELILLGEDGVPFFDVLRPKAYLISGKSWVNNHAHVFRGMFVSNRFLTHYLNTFDYSGRIVGATRGKLNKSKAVNIPIAIPPLSEQHRIVAKVDELMALCDRLEASQQAREARRDSLAAASLQRLNQPAENVSEFRQHAKFHLRHLPRLTTRPDQIKQLRQTILTLAVRGKLVPQDPKDEHASKLLMRIGRQQPFASTNADISSRPFKINPGWSWVGLQYLLDPHREISYGVIKLGIEPKTGGISTLRCSDVKPRKLNLANVRRVAEEIEREYQRTRLEGGELLLNIRGTLGGVAIVPPDLKGYNVAREVAVIPISCHMSAQYVLAVMASQYFWATILSSLRGIAYKGINLGALRLFELPVPPLAEQKRIAAKVDELMAICDRLEAQLTTAQTESSRLLEAVLYEALAP